MNNPNIVRLVPVVSVTRKELVENYMESAKNLLVDAMGEGDESAILSEVNRTLRNLLHGNEESVRSEFRAGTTMMMVPDRVRAELEFLNDSNCDNYVVFVEGVERRGEPSNNEAPIIVHSKDVSW